MFNSYYTTGTVTITSGSPNFTTSGAALQSADIRPGDVVIHNGLALVIASITGQNAGTFTANAPADAAGAGVPLRIIMQNDGSRLSANQVNLIALLSGGNVQALAGLTGTADTGLHFTGAGAMATHPLTAFGRAVAGLTGANGSFIRATGANTAVAQSILGAVSHSGGVPNGSLFEYGANSNGSYIRSANRMQVCWARRVITVAGDLTASISFPATFAEEPVIIPMPDGNTPDWNNTADRFISVRQRDAGTGGTRFFLSSAPAGGNIVLKYIGIGRGV